MLKFSTKCFYVDTPSKLVTEKKVFFSVIFQGFYLITDTCTIILTFDRYVSMLLL